MGGTGRLEFCSGLPGYALIVAVKNYDAVNTCCAKIKNRPVCTIAGAVLFFKFFKYAQASGSSASGASASGSLASGSTTSSASASG